MLPSFCKDVVTVERAGRTVSRGSTVLDWTQSTMRTIAGCSVQDGNTSLTLDGHTLAVGEDATLYAPEGADVAAGDRVSFDGRTWVINGAPRIMRSATGAVSHIEAPLKAWEA